MGYGDALDALTIGPRGGPAPRRPDEARTAHRRGIVTLTGNVCAGRPGGRAARNAVTAVTATAAVIATRSGGTRP